MHMVKLVKCTEQYWEFVRSLRNDTRVSDGFIDPTEITNEMQINYMKLYSDSYRIALYNNIPAGYVGVVDGDIRVCTHPDFQRLGIAKFMINECTKLWPDSVARIKLNNIHSLRLFQSCGFVIRKKSEQFHFLTL